MFFACLFVYFISSETFNTNAQSSFFHSFLSLFSRCRCFHILNFVKHKRIIIIIGNTDIAIDPKHKHSFIHSFYAYLLTNKIKVYRRIVIKKKKSIRQIQFIYIESNWIKRMFFLASFPFLHIKRKKTFNDENGFSKMILLEIGKIQPTKSFRFSFFFTECLQWAKVSWI